VSTLVALAFDPAHTRRIRKDQLAWLFSALNNAARLLASLFVHRPQVLPVTARTTDDDDDDERRPKPTTALEPIFMTSFVALFLSSPS
jgi:hypothetical protein